MKNILAAVDFSDISGDVIRRAGEFAHAFSAHLWIVHVASPDPDFVGYEAGPQHERDWRATALHDEHQKIQEAARKLEADGINATPLLVQGPTVETILGEISRLDIDLVIAGSHGHGALFELLVGSVTEELLKKSPVPVVVIPGRKN